ncbi:hypothetical protein HQ447_17025 [bacterium]|nr:hypothetical protein [bacterium]
MKTTLSRLKKSRTNKFLISSPTSQKSAIFNLHPLLLVHGRQPRPSVAPGGGK